MLHSLPDPEHQAVGCRDGFLAGRRTGGNDDDNADRGRRGPLAQRVRAELAAFRRAAVRSRVGLRDLEVGPALEHDLHVERAVEADEPDRLIWPERVERADRGLQAAIVGQAGDAGSEPGDLAGEGRLVYRAGVPAQPGQAGRRGQRPSLRRPFQYVEADAGDDDPDGDDPGDDCDPGARWVPWGFEVYAAGWIAVARLVSVTGLGVVALLGDRPGRWDVAGLRCRLGLEPEALLRRWCGESLRRGVGRKLGCGPGGRLGNRPGGRLGGGPGGRLGGGPGGR